MALRRQFDADHDQHQHRHRHSDAPNQPGTPVTDTAKARQCASWTRVAITDPVCARWHMERRRIRSRATPR